MAWAVNKYGYINAKLRALLSKRISREQFSTMIGAGSLTEALQVLNGTEYGTAFNVYHETGDIKMVELELVRREIESLMSLRKTLDEDVVDIINGFLEGYELSALKDALRYWFDRSVRNRPVDDHVLYMMKDPIVFPIDYSAVVYADTPKDVVSLLEGTPYRQIVNDLLSEVLEGTTLFPVESRLDNLYFKRLFDKIDALSEKDRVIARRIIGIQVDMENIARLSRLIRLDGVNGPLREGTFVPGGSNIDVKELKTAAASKSPREFIKNTVTAYYGTPGIFEGKERERDDTFFVLLLSVLQDIFIDEVMKLLKGYPFTVGIVLAYCFIKQHETTKITAVLNAHYYGIDETRMREMV